MLAGYSMQLRRHELYKLSKQQLGGCPGARVGAVGSIARGPPAQLGEPSAHEAQSFNVSMQGIYQPRGVHMHARCMRLQMCEPQAKASIVSPSKHLSRGIRARHRAQLNLSDLVRCSRSRGVEVPVARYACSSAGR